jgi:hypothetical protein
VVWLKDSAIICNRCPLVIDRKHGLLKTSQSWGFIRELQKRACPRMPDPNLAHGRSSDLVKLKRELEFPSLNSPKSHYTILQTVSSTLIHIIQQLDVKLISEAIL